MMTRALFHKQMMEVFSWVYQNKKTGKNRSKRGIISYVLLYLLIFGFLGVIFFMLADTLCEPLISFGLGWMYMALMGLISLALGVFGSVFNTFASLYQAKDNDLLLSMPISPSRILLVRLSGVFAIGLMYELIVMIPTLIVWFLTASLNAAGVLFSLMIPLVLSVIILALSAVLGWLVALISSRLRNKNFIVVILSLAFFAAYYYFYAKAYSMVESLLANPQAVGDKIKSILYPIYHMGLASEGNALSMLIFIAITALLFAVVYLVLSRSFLHITTMNRGAARVRYQEKRAKERSVRQALLYKERKRFMGSANYMLNCGLGIVFMLIAAVFLLIKANTISEVLGEFSLSADLVSLLATASLCFIISMNDITAPSVSLEGKNIWLLQSYPVAAKQVLMAKLRHHLILTLIPAYILMAALEWVLKPPVVFAVLIPVTVTLFAIFMAEFGLAVNLKTPNLTWTSEIVPIKQSAGVMLCLFGGWVVVIVLGIGFYFLSSLLSPMLFLIVTDLLFFALNLVILWWIRTKGAQIFAHL